MSEKAQKIKTFDQEVERMIEYIKDSTSKRNPWVIIKVRDVPEITGASSFYTKKIFEQLKNHPEVVFEVYEEAKTTKKPIRFRIAKNPDEKIEAVITEKSFYYLNEEDVQIVKDAFKDSGYEELFTVLSVINYISHIGGKREHIEVSPENIAEMLVEDVEKMENVLEMITNRIGSIDIEGKVKLLLSSEEIDLDEDDNSPRTEEPSQISLKDRINSLFNTEEVENSNEKEEDLVLNLENFRESVSTMNKQFEDFLQGQIIAITEHKRKSQEIEDSYKAMNELVKENSKLKKEIDDIKNKNAELNKKLNLSMGSRDKFIENAEGRFEILLAEIMNMTTDYVNTPNWQKDNARNAKLQKGILGAVTSAIDDLLKE